MTVDTQSRADRVASVAFLVGEIPCAPFIAALINGVAARRTVIVMGSERSGKRLDVFGANVSVERCPQSRLGRVRYTAGCLLRLVGRGSLELEPLWRFIMKNGRRHAFSRLLYALPILLHRPEIVHVQWAKALHRTMELTELYSFAIVLSLRGTHISSSPLGDAELLREYQQDFPGVHAFHAVCHAIEADAVALGALPDRIRVIYSGIDEAVLALPLMQLRSELRPLRILSVGRIHWRKGYHRALDAIGQLVRTYQVEYRIIAGSPDDELLLQLHDLGILESVHFEPAMSQTEVMEQMRTKADVLLVPSMGEGIANVAIEAMALGLPVVATHCGGMPELIDHGRTGLLCDPWDVHSMVDALKSFADMPLDRREEMRTNARDEIAATRRLGGLVSAMQVLYDEAMVRSQREKL
ncbi:MAG: glycosyltransferase family 4 protein [Verrucomicrobiales bacterium]